MVKNRVYSIRRCLESVLNQDYPNIEYVIQDGASTDGTLEILKEYERRYPHQVRLVSSQDKNPEEVFFRTLRRCSGEIIGSCWSDDELLPWAVSWAVKNMALHPGVAAIYGGYYTTDIDGNIIGEDGYPPSFNIENYLCHKITPPFASSFFRRECLHKVGLKRDDWTLGVGEFELWLRLGLVYPVQAIPEIVAKYNISPVSSSLNPETTLGLIKPRKWLMERVFSDPSTSPHIRSLEMRAYAGLHLWAGLCLLNTGKTELVWKQIFQSLHYKPEFGYLVSVWLRALYKTVMPRDQFFRSIYRKVKSKRILLQHG
ncbi:MAG: glycosyltransferase [Chloroflexota bacterium]